MDQFRKQIVSLCQSNECYANNFKTTYNGITGLKIFQFYKLFFLRHLFIFLIPIAVIITIGLRYFLFAVRTMEGLEEFFNFLTLKNLFLYIALPASVFVNCLIVKKIAPSISVFRYDKTAYLLIDRIWLYFVYVKMSIGGKPGSRNSSYKLLNRIYYLYEIKPKGISFHEDLYQKLKTEFECEHVTIDLINLYSLFSSRVKVNDDEFINKAVKQYDHLFNSATNSFVMISDSNKKDFEQFADYLWEHHYKEDEQYISALIRDSFNDLSPRKRKRLIQNIQSNPVKFNLFGLKLEDL